MNKKLEQEIEENRKMCSNWYEEGRGDMIVEVIKLIDEFDKDFDKGTSQSFLACWGIIKEELKDKLKGEGK